MKSLLSLRQEIKARLSGVSIADADREACLLIMHALKLSPVELALNNDRTIDEAELPDLMKLVEQRCSRIPVSQIFGEKEFWSLVFKVTPDTLTPRPDSEILIETTLKIIGDKNGQYRILDLGTGTGCLLLTLLCELQNAVGVGVDISQDALEVAILNAQKHVLTNRSEFRLGNWISCLNPEEQFDVIISNPPYIGKDEIDGLSPEVRDHEPHIALFSGQDGLEDYRKIAKSIYPFLRSNGHVVLEIGYRQAHDVKEIFTSAGFNKGSLYHDLGGRDRCLVFEKTGI